MPVKEKNYWLLEALPQKSEMENRNGRSPSKYDLLFENHFSLFLIRPVSKLGQQWLDENVGENTLTFGEAVVCEPRYVEGIFLGAQSDGLVVSA